MKQKFTLLSILILSSFGLFAQSNSTYQRKVVAKKIALPSANLVNVLPEINDVPKRKCATPPKGEANEAYEAWIADVLQKEAQFANVKRTSVVYNIPVVFHILHPNQTVGSGMNITQAQINSQLTVLNQAFRKTNTDLLTYATNFQSVAADCEINFCAALVSPTGTLLAEPGIDRINTVAKGWTAPPYSSPGGGANYIEQTIKPGSSWDPTKYLNIWILSFNDGTLGYAQFPTVPSSATPTIGDMAGMGGAANTDGVAFDYRYVGTTGTATAPYNKGRTAVHEIGHWLGLYHIWGDDFGACSGTDNVADTPNQGSENYTCPTPNGKVVTDGCSSASPGVNYQNYMDYSDDACMVMFTAGQKARMQACMQYCTRRTSLSTSTVCTSTGINETVESVTMDVFPNPTKGDLNINVNTLNTQDFTIQVVNTLGQTVEEMKQVQSNGGTYKMDLSQLNNGIYFVILKSKSGTKTKRIVLQ